jgi:hypothetical protein
MPFWQPIHPLTNYPLILSAVGPLPEGSPPYCIASGQEIHLEALELKQRVSEIVLGDGASLEGRHNSRTFRSIATGARSSMTGGSIEDVFRFIASVHMALLQWDIRILDNHWPSQQVSCYSDGL